MQLGLWPHTDLDLHFHDRYSFCEVINYKIAVSFTNHDPAGAGIYAKNAAGEFIRCSPMTPKTTAEAHACFKDILGKRNKGTSYTMMYPHPQGTFTVEWKNSRLTIVKRRLSSLLFAKEIALPETSEETFQTAMEFLIPIVASFS